MELIAHIFHGDYSEDAWGTQLDHYFFHKKRAYFALCQSLGFDEEVDFGSLISFFITKPGKKWLAKKFDLDEKLTWIDMLEIFREDLALKYGLQAEADWNEIEVHEDSLRAKNPNCRIWRPNKKRIANRMKQRAEAANHDIDEIVNVVGEIPEGDYIGTMRDLAEAAEPDKREEAEKVEG